MRASRAALAESLWESLEDPYCIPIAEEDAAALRLSDQRDQELEEVTVAPLAHDDLMRRLRG